MFDRIAYKTTAKATLKGNWNVPALVSLVSLGIEFLLSLPGATAEPENAFSFMSLTATILSVLVSGILTLSSTCFFVSFVAQGGKTRFNSFVEAMNRWAEGICGILWQTLWICLWSLLLLVPGIVKAYSYSQMFLIMAEIPGISVKKAMNLSKAMTKGFKGDLFMMDLSFIGWAFLCLLTAGIGFIWLVSYIATTQVNAYHFIKQQAISTGKLSEADFSR